MRKILYTMCLPDEYFKNIVQSGTVLSQASQKFNKLFIKGFCLNGYDVDVLLSWKEIIPQEFMKESFNGHMVNYITVCSEKKRFIKFIDKKRKIKDFIRLWALNNPKGTVVVDALSPLSYNALKFAKYYGLNAITVITDLKLKSLNVKTGLANKIKQEYLFKRFYKQFSYTSSFVFLTEQMEEKINLHKKPYIIINGMCDYSLLFDNDIVNCDKNIIMYTGEISKFYGAENLVRAFLNLNDRHLQLHLYGSMFYPELNEIQKQHPNVKYMGIVPNEEMIRRQREALILVNPRLVEGEYNRYSFPSKNIEYMTSGRPVITTKLPCITEKYNGYYYFFKDDTVDGMTESLRYYTALSNEALDIQGKKAKKFVLQEMNNKVQIERVIKKLI